MSLQLEAIPAGCTGRNLHNSGILSREKWNDISQRVRTGKWKEFSFWERGRKHSVDTGSCSCCGKRFGLPDLHAHEVWSFDPEKRIQKLERIICACSKCHDTIHYHHYFSNRGLTDREAFIAKAHYMEVNFCGEGDFETALDGLLEQYRRWNQAEGSWSMDVSYILREGLALYREISLENLEKAAPGSQQFLEPYRDRPQLAFSHIPEECLDGWGERLPAREEPEPCEICGKKERVLYAYYDFRVRRTVPELVLADTRKICRLCRKTIYCGAGRLFMRYRKTTRHYMEVNRCSYQECRQHADNAKMLKNGNRRAQLYVYLNTPYLPDKEARTAQNNYLKSQGAAFDWRLKKWYLRPAKNLAQLIRFLL